MSNSQSLGLLLILATSCCFAGCDKAELTLTPDDTGFTTKPSSVSPEIERPSKNNDPVSAMTNFTVVAAPWTIDSVKAVFAVGRKWTLRREQLVWVGPKKQTSFELIESKVLAVDDKGFTVEERRLDAKGEVILEARQKVGEFASLLRPYRNLRADQTTVSDTTIRVAGKDWPCKLYRNRSIVEQQTQILSLWTSVDSPGLTLKMKFQSPRLTETIQVVNFESGA